MKKIILTGGGTAGHVMPNLALVPGLRERGFEIHYVGTDAIEKDLVEEYGGIEFHRIDAEKLRRYPNLRTATAPARVAKGFVQSLAIMRRVKPNVVFSKGGYVSAPVVWASKLSKIRTIIHEGDITPGLTTKLTIPFADVVCYTFEKSAKYFPEKKRVFTGLPVRDDLKDGDESKGRKLCGFNARKPVVLVMGGSQGSQMINKTVEKALPGLSNFQVCHLVGKGNKVKAQKGYKAFEFVSEELKHLFAMAHVVVSRAGTTAINELLFLQKPNLLIPLGTGGSRGEQIDNAESFRQKNYSYVLPEPKLSAQSLTTHINHVYEHREIAIQNMKDSEANQGTNKVLDIISR